METHTMTSSSGLQCTIHGGDEAMLRKVVERMEKGTLTTPDGGSTLHMAAAEGKTEDCHKFLVLMNCDINATDSKGETPLFRAIYYQKWETMFFLIENGADVNWSAKSGETPLHIAANKGNKDIIEFLVSEGADLHANSYYGTPLCIAAASGNPNTLGFLLELKADPNPTIPSLNSTTIFLPSGKGSVQTMELHITPSPTQSLDQTPIFLATSKGSIECMELLMKAGADLNRASYLSTPLRAASLFGEEVVRCLLKGGADPNILDPVGRKPIEYAAWDGLREAVELLFPVTSRIAWYPDWSVDGIMLHAQSKEGKALFQSTYIKIYALAKAKGDEALKKNPINYYDAYGFYIQANLVDQNDSEVLCNLSLCRAMMHNGNDALRYAKECIALKPRWAKAHFREGVAFKVLKDFKNASKSLVKARDLDPRDKEINKELRAVRAELFNRKH